MNKLQILLAALIGYTALGCQTDENPTSSTTTEPTVTTETFTTGTETRQ